VEIFIIPIGGISIFFYLIKKARKKFFFYRLNETFSNIEEQKYGGRYEFYNCSDLSKLLYKICDMNNPIKL